jgi:hypothetical protein
MSTIILNEDAIALRTERLKIQEESGKTLSDNEQVGFLFLDLADVIALRESALSFEDSRKDDLQYIDFHTEGRRLFSNEATLQLASEVLEKIAAIHLEEPIVYESNDDVIRRKDAILLQITKETLFYGALKKLVNRNTILQVTHRANPYQFIKENTIYAGKFDADLFTVIEKSIFDQKADLRGEDMVTLLKLACTKEAFDTMLGVFESRPVFWGFNEYPSPFLSVFRQHVSKGNTGVLTELLKYRARCDGLMKHTSLPVLLESAVTNKIAHPKLEQWAIRVAEKLGVQLSVMTPIVGQSKISNDCDCATPVLK